MNFAAQSKTLCTIACGTATTLKWTRLGVPLPLQVSSKRREPQALAALSTTGLFEHPAHDMPPPASTRQPTVFSTRGDATLEGFGLEGQIFIDGSADQHVIGDLRRAGWGVVQVDDEGFATAGVYYLSVARPFRL